MSTAAATTAAATTAESEPEATHNNSNTDNDESADNTSNSSKYSSHWRIFRHASDIATNHALLSDPHLLPAPPSASNKAGNSLTCVECASGGSAPSNHPLNVQLLTLAKAIMTFWGEKWATVEQGNQWASFLNKKTLKEEVEESLVAVAPLINWLERTAAVANDGSNDGSDKNEEGHEDGKQKNETGTNSKITVVDVCCGKGICSILLSYLCGFAKSSHYRPSAFRRIDKIVMLDRQTSKNVDWNHIHEANKTAVAEQRPIIELWEGTNLHDTDVIYDKLYALRTPLALIGIHLCRHLSPAAVGLVNALGPTRAPFLCLAPCCLPRQARRRKRKNEEVSIIQIPLYEEPAARKQRVEAMALRQRALQRGVKGAKCYLCQSPDHFVRSCPQLPPEGSPKRKEILENAAPCWRCGKVGHEKSQCPEPASAPCRPRFIPPPTTRLDCFPAACAEDKFGTYCTLLAKTVQDYKEVKMVRAPLAKKSGHGEGGENNWNSARKSTFIVVER